VATVGGAVGLGLVYTQVPETNAAGGPAVSPGD
jgi:hypothetical protein